MGLKRNIQKSAVLGNYNKNNNSIEIKVRNKLLTLFCVHNDLCDSSAWLVDSWGVGEINQSWARIVKDIMNSEKCYVIHLLCNMHYWYTKFIWTKWCYKIVYGVLVIKW